MSTSNKFTIERKGTKRVLRVAGELPAGFHGEKTDGTTFVSSIRSTPSPQDVAPFRG